MPTIMKFPLNRTRTNAIDRFKPPLRFAVYALALASLIFGPKPVLTGEAKIGVPLASDCTD